MKYLKKLVQVVKDLYKKIESLVKKPKKEIEEFNTDFDKEFQ